MQPCCCIQCPGVANVRRGGKRGRVEESGRGGGREEEEEEVKEGRREARRVERKEKDGERGEKES